MMDDGTFTNSQTTENGDENFGLMDSQQSVQSSKNFESLSLDQIPANF